MSFTRRLIAATTLTATVPFAIPTAAHAAPERDPMVIVAYPGNYCGESGLIEAEADHLRVIALISGYGPVTYPSWCK
jgi:hypothetical protein